MVRKNGDGEIEGHEACYVFGNYIDEVLVMVRGGADYYFGQDHLFSTVALYKIDSGDFALAERYEYDAYGKATVYTAMADWNTANPTTQSYSTVGNGYTFTGRRLDTLDNAGHNVMYYRARYYDTETGRFIQRDPLGIDPAGGEMNLFNVSGQYADGLNIYQYVSSDAINSNDSYGLKKLRRDLVRGAFERWYITQPSDGWWEVLPKCPVKLCFQKGKPQLPKASSGNWINPEKPSGAEKRLHPGTVWSMRSKPVGQHSNQCTYNSEDNLLTGEKSAGTVDFFSPSVSKPLHYMNDVLPIYWAVFLDCGIDMNLTNGKMCQTPGKYMKMYYEKRPPYDERPKSSPGRKRCCN